MKKCEHPSTLLVCLILAMLFLAACNLPSRTVATPENPNIMFTVAAQTVAVELTRAASLNQIKSPTPQPGSPTVTGQSPMTSSTPTPTNSIEIPPEGTNTPTPSITPTETPCDRASFEDDVTIPDGTDMEPGEVLTKVWRLENTGSCTWTSGYSLVFEEGEAMDGPASTQLTTGTVAPGQTVDISVELTAPDASGTYRGYWRLRDPDGILFGINDDAKTFWVEIDVVSETGLMYDFIAQASSADWGSGVANDDDDIDFEDPGETSLTFGGPDTDPNGFAMIKDAVKYEGGGTSGKILETHPKMEDNGYIVGRFPEYAVKVGDYISGRLGFIAKADGSCDTGKAIFQINYTIEDDLDTMETLGSWHEKCDGNLLAIEISLAGIKGESVNFYLLVLANGSPTEDWAIWSSLAVFR